MHLSRYAVIPLALAVALANLLSPPALATPITCIERVENREFELLSFEGIPQVVTTATPAGTGPQDTAPQDTAGPPAPEVHVDSLEEAGWLSDWIQSAGEAFGSPGLLQAHAAGPLEIELVSW